MHSFRTTREFVVLDAQELVMLGIPHDLSAELIPCTARGKFDDSGKPVTLHLTHLGGCLSDPNVASVVFSPKGLFLRMVLQRGGQDSRHRSSSGI